MLFATYPNAVYFAFKSRAEINRAIPTSRIDPIGARETSLLEKINFKFRFVEGETRYWFHFVQVFDNANRILEKEEEHRQTDIK